MTGPNYFYKVKNTIILNNVFEINSEKKVLEMSLKCRF
jgi:hypothetical protein